MGLMGFSYHVGVGGDGGCGMVIVGPFWHRQSIPWYRLVWLYPWMGNSITAQMWERGLWSCCAVLQFVT